MSRSEWDDAADDFLARERARLGDPPTAEEVTAYSRGELSEDDAARVRALLVVHPEAAEALTRNVALADDVLSDAEVASDWASIQKRIATPEPRRPSFLQRTLPIAAMIAFAALGALLIHSQMKIRRLTAERDRPRFSTSHELLPAEEVRGPKTDAPYLLPRNDDADYQLALLLYDDVDGEVRVNITSSTSPRRIWSGSVSAPRNRTIELSVPRAFFQPGNTYRLDVYGAGSSTPLSSYFVRVQVSS